MSIKYSYLCQSHGKVWLAQYYMQPREKLSGYHEASIHAKFIFYPLIKKKKYSIKIRADIDKFLNWLLKCSSLKIISDATKAERIKGKEKDLKKFFFTF